MTELSTTAQCKQAEKPDGSGNFWYKASPAKCFKFYVEFASEADCSNNQNPAEGNSQTYPFLTGRSNEQNSFDKMCSVHNSKAYRITCNSEDNGAN